MTSPEREPQFPIATVEYGPEQIQLLEKYLEEADIYKRALLDIRRKTKFKTQIEQAVARENIKMELYILTFSGIVKELKNNEKITITKNDDSSYSLFSSPSFSSPQLPNDSYFSTLLDVLWPTQYPENSKQTDVHMSNSEIIKRDIRASLLIHSRATLKPSP